MGGPLDGIQLAGHVLTKKSHLIPFIKKMQKMKKKNKYQISIEQGDFLGKYTECLPYTWTNLKVAQQNLQWIKEHYLFFKKFRYGNENLGEFYQTSAWFVYEPELWCISSNCIINEFDKSLVGGKDWEYRPKRYDALHSLNILLDNHKKVEVGAFWCHAIELALTAEIIIVDGLNPNKIDFTN